MRKKDEITYHCSKQAYKPWFQDCRPNGVLCFPIFGQRFKKTRTSFFTLFFRKAKQFVVVLVCTTCCPVLARQLTLIVHSFSFLFFIKFPLQPYIDKINYFQ